GLFFADMTRAQSDVRAGWEADMRRRDVLGAAGSIAAGGAFFPAPAVAQGVKQLTMVTAWPAGSAGLQTSAERLARAIGTAAGGRLTIQVFAAGARVSA